MSFKNLGYGLGLRSDHFDHVLHETTQLNWFEVITENYLGYDLNQKHKAISELERVRRDYQIALHGVSMSLGSTDPLNKKYLQNLKTLIDIVNPAIVSDHLCWVSAEGVYLHDLLPLP